MEAGVAVSAEVARILIVFGAILITLEVFVPGGILGFLGAGTDVRVRAAEGLTSLVEPIEEREV